MFTLLKRIFRQGWKNATRQGTMTLSAIILTGISLFLLGFLVFLQGFTFHVVTQLREQVDVSVYFKENATEQEIFAAKEELEKLSEVKEITYISPDEAFSKFQMKFSDEPVILESLAEVGRNPFLAALTIKVWESPQYEAVINFLEASPFEELIESIDYQKNKDMIDRLFTVTKGAMRSVFIFGAILSILSFLVMFNAIRLAIAHSQKEIAIMRLVGADRFFATGPFLVQGALMGLAAGLMVLLLIGIISLSAGKHLEGWTAGFHPFKYFLQHFLLFFAVEVLLGTILGIFSSWLAIRKYLT